MVPCLAFVVKKSLLVFVRRLIPCIWLCAHHSHPSLVSPTRIIIIRLRISDINEFIAVLICALMKAKVKIKI
jgi:hypothetical protein